VGKAINSLIVSFNGICYFGTCAGEGNLKREFFLEGGSDYGESKRMGSLISEAIS